jgi:alpha/beta superfamily hydrolase
VPTLAVCGTADPYCPTADFERFVARFGWLTPVLIDGADHFFFGKLFPLGEAVGDWARRLAGPAR